MNESFVKIFFNELDQFKDDEINHDLTLPRFFKKKCINYIKIFLNYSSI